jgi:hypothetical protein
MIGEEKMTKKEKMKAEFDWQLQNTDHLSKMVVAIMLPSGAKEIIINTEHIIEKMDYYMNAYDDELQLKANFKVRILNYMFV